MPKGTYAMLLKNKKYLQSLLFLTFVFSTFISGIAYTGSAQAQTYNPPKAPGCYNSQGNTITCDTTAIDQNGVQLDPSAFCYIDLVVKVGVSQWQNVSCSDLTTEVNQSSNCTNGGSGASCVNPTFKTCPVGTKKHGTDGNGDAICGTYFCGSGNDAVATSFNIGCKGLSCQTSSGGSCSALLDGLFAVIRFLSQGVGILVIASIVYAGIQFTASRGDPNATAKAIGRVRSSIIALIVYIFSYAILNYLIPAGFFK